MYKVGDGAWSEEPPTGGDAGTYTISYQVVGGDNHKDSAEGQLTVTIAKKAVTVTPDSLTKVYDEDPELTYTAEGLVGEDTLADITLARAEGENAGTYAVP